MRLTPHSTLWLCTGLYLRLDVVLVVSMIAILQIFGLSAIHHMKMYVWNRQPSLPTLLCFLGLFSFFRTNCSAYSWKIFTSGNTWLSLMSSHVTLCFFGPNMAETRLVGGVSWRSIVQCVTSFCQLVVQFDVKTTVSTTVSTMRENVHVQNVHVYIY